MFLGNVITFKNGISFEEKVYNKHIINTVACSDALYHVSWIFLDLTHSYSTLCVSCDTLIQ